MEEENKEVEETKEKGQQEGEVCEFIGGPWDGKNERVKSSLRYIQIPEGFCLHVYKRSEVRPLRFFYRGKDEPKEIKRKIIEGME